METARRSRVVDLSIWGLNIFSSVTIIMVNKQLMGSSGYRFTFATTLCALHMLTTSLLGVGMRLAGHAEKSVNVPMREIALFVLVADLAIISQNLSLMLNSVGFYQIAKIAIIPFTCMVEFIFYGKRFSLVESLSIAVVSLGIGISTVTDVEFNFLGSAVALVGVVTTSLQQIFVGKLQAKYSVTSMELLNKTAWLQGGSMLLVGPLVDHVITGDNLSEYEFSVPSLAYLVASCLVAILVNLSQFMAISRFSAISFQVVGHIKTILVLSFGFLLFGNIVSVKNLMGIALAVVGIIVYGMVQNNKKKAAEAKASPAVTAATDSEAPKIDQR